MRALVVRRAAIGGGATMSEVFAPPSTNGSSGSPPSTHELLRLRVQDRLRRDGADDVEVARTGIREPAT